MSDETMNTDQDTPAGGGDGPSAEEVQAWNEFEQADAAAADQGAAGNADDRGFDEATAEDTGNDRKASGDDTSPGAGGSSAESGADIWESATPEQRSALESLKAENADLARRRQGQDRKIRELNENLIRATQAPPPPAKDGAEPMNLGEEWEAFREEYGEVAGPVEALLRSQQGKIDGLQRQLSAMGQNAIDSVISDNEARLAERFPDYAAVASSREFGEWAQAQPRMVQEAIMRNGEAIVDVHEAADVLQRYQESRQGGTPPAHATTQSRRRDRQLASSRGAAPNRRGGAVVSGIPQDGDPETLWKQLDQAGL